MKQSLPVMMLMSFMLWYWGAKAQSVNYRLKIEEGFTKQGTGFVKVDSSYFNYPNATVGDEWGNDFSEYYSFGRDSANQLFKDNGYKTVFEYDANMRELSRTYYYLDNNNWEFDLKWENTYNAQGKVIKFSRFVLILGNLVEDYRITHTYNANGYLIQRLEQKVSSGTTTNDYNKLYTRDALGNLTDYVYQKWVNNAWENNRRTVSTFKAATTLADTVLQYDWVNNAWRTLTRDITTYNASGLVTENIKETFNQNTQAFGNYLRQTKSYNASNKLTLYTFYTWLASSWRIDREISYQTYTGDFFGRATVKEPNSTNNQLENVSRTDHVFNTDGWRIRSRDYNWENNAWVEVANRDFTFEAKQSTSVNEHVTIAELKAYPNPFSTNTIIEFEVTKQGETQVEIYSTTGQKVHQLLLYTPQGYNQFMWNGTDMKGDAVQAGIYVVRIQNGNHLQFTKLIKL